MKVAVVGLGRMGSAIAQRLTEQGMTVTGWDRNDKAVAALAAAGIATAPGPAAAAAAADVVISIITEDNGVRGLFTGQGGFLDGDVKGKLFIEMSTLQPMTGRELAPQVAEKGAALIESPVLGTIPSVRAGQLVAMVGGAAADLDRGRPVLEKLTRRIVHMGPNGAGYAMKLAANLGLAAYIQSIAESLALGERQGLDRDLVLDVLCESATVTNWLKAKLPVLKGERGEVTLDIATLRKDAMSAVATAALSGIGLPLTAGTLASLSAAVAEGYGGEDIAAVATFFRKHMGQNFG